MKKICGKIFWVLMCLTLVGCIIFSLTQKNWAGASVCGLALTADICCAVDYFQQVKETKQLKRGMKKFEGSIEVEPNINDFII